MFKGLICFVLTMSFCLYAASMPPVMAQEGAPTPIDEWKSFLNTLDKKDPASVKRALDAFNERFGKEGASPPKDAAFMAFRSFYYGAIEQQGNRFMNDQKLQMQLWDGKKGKELLEKLKKTLSASGMTLYMSEGSYYIAEDAAFLLSSFAPQLTDSLREYLTIRSDELKKGFLEDAGLVITWKELADRLGTWDRYLARHSGSPLKAQALENFRLCREIFLAGVDNSRLFTDRGTLEPKVKEAYEYYVKTYKDTKSAALVSDYYGLLKQGGFKDSAQRRQFLRKNGIVK